MRGSRRTLHLFIAPVAVLGVLVASCAGDEAPEGDVQVVMRDFELEVSPGSAPAGELVFVGVNEGPSIHEFEIFQGDAAADSLPVESGVANTEGLTLLDEVEDITQGSNATLTLTLDAGHYVIMCNLPGHYEQGMSADFTVE
jgi:uncharacterized cupredoxin-like copper-binding protein